MSRAVVDQDAKRRELATIHIAKKELGLDDETYRAMLWTVARVRSSAELDFTGRKRVLAHLKSRGFKSKPGKTGTAARPRNFNDPDRGPSLRKIEALLLDAERTWAYVSRGAEGKDSLVKRICGVDAIEFADVDGLQRLVAVLQIDQNRRLARRLARKVGG